MADDSPGKVQALRAMFSENNQPLMGMLPPSGKLQNHRPWKSSIEPSEQLPAKKPAPAHNNNGMRPRPAPKPARLSQQPATRTAIADENISHQDKAKAVAETIASFMFANGLDNIKHATDSRTNYCSTQNDDSRTDSSQTDSRTDSQTESLVVRQCNAKNIAKSEFESLRISSDNYICKSSSNFRRKELPPPEALGPAPAKPDRPPHLVLPAKYRPCPPVPARNNPQPPPVISPPAVPLRPGIQRPSHPCPTRPHTPPPLPPVLAPVIKPRRLSLREEIEELYEDTLLGESKRPTSLIPEFTEEEESEELYNDAGPDEAPPPFPPATPKKPPPPCPSEYLQPNVISSGSCEKLYQDAEDPYHEEFYEEMPCEGLPEPEETNSPLYSNNKKEIEKMKREEEKKLRKEQKEREKRDKENEKLKRKFGLTGEEIPIDDGLVKSDSRGGRGGDLPVKRGEVVLILRMEGNPSGRWLVKNEKGKIGYVELTNIEVDPLSVKSVMSIRRFSVISASEELYTEAKSYSEEESIYEVTY